MDQFHYDYIQWKHRTDLKNKASNFICGILILLSTVFLYRGEGLSNINTFFISALIWAIFAYMHRLNLGVMEGNIYKLGMNVSEAEKLIKAKSNASENGIGQSESSWPSHELKEFKQNSLDQLSKQNAWHAIITVGYFAEIFLSIILLVAGVVFSFIEPISIDLKIAYQIILGSLSIAIILEIISLFATRAISKAI